MELVQVYNQFVADSNGEVATKLNTEYGVNINGMTFDISFIPPYLDGFHDDWKAFICTDDDIEFYFIVNTNTMKLEELQLIA